MPALHYRCLVDSIAFNVRLSPAVPGNFIEFTVNTSDYTIKGDAKICSGLLFLWDTRITTASLVPGPAAVLYC